MSVELSDEEFPDLEVTLANGRLLVGPNMHPANLVRWVVACYEKPDRVIIGDGWQHFTGADIVRLYLRPCEVGRAAHLELERAVMARWGGT